MDKNTPYDHEAARRAYIVDYCFLDQLTTDVTFVYKGETFKILQRIDINTLKVESDKRVIYLPNKTLVVTPKLNGQPIDIMELEGFSTPGHSTYKPNVIPLFISLN